VLQAGSGVERRFFTGMRQDFINLQGGINLELLVIDDSLVKVVFIHIGQKRIPKSG
jgi:hypothetical protein